MNEFASSRIPDSETKSGWRIALVKIGIVIALPSFLVGAELGFQLGLEKSGIAIVFGCAVLAVLSSMTGTVGASCRLPTAVITEFAFGRWGARVTNLILAITLIGWFSVTLELFANTLQVLFKNAWSLTVRTEIFVLGGGTLMVLTTVFGFKALGKLSNVAVPALFSVLVVMAGLAVQGRQFSDFLGNSGEAISIGYAISAVVGGPAAGTVIFPDIARFARNENHGRGAAILSYGIGMPSILLLVGITAIATNERDLMLIMLGLGMGAIALVFLVFTAWTTNTGNLYSGSLFLSKLYYGIEHRMLVLVAGVLGCMLALFGITDHFIPFLVALGIAVPPIAGIYVSSYFLRGCQFDLNELDNNRAFDIAAFVGWISGILVAYLGIQGVVTVTSIPACDSILVSAAIFVAAKQIFNVLATNSVKKEN